MKAVRTKSWLKKWQAARRAERKRKAILDADNKAMLGPDECKGTRRK